MDGKTILLEQLSRVTKTFVKALEEFPEDKFHLSLPAGGHSAAWHALHIADWVQILVPNKLESVGLDLRFGYLGWEEADFAKNIYAIGAVHAESSKSEILAHLKAHLERANHDLQAAQDSQLENSVVTPMGERKILPMLLTHIAHLPYHYGQVKLNLKQL
jgi:uncharacterized damage-inducible protein DinB